MELASQDRGECEREREGSGGEPPSFLSRLAD